MYQWYAKAEECYAHLADVTEEEYPSKTTRPHEAFKASSWFTRGWTLQELIAPERVIFMSANWQPLGQKYIMSPSTILHLGKSDYGLELETPLLWQLAMVKQPGNPDHTTFDDFIEAQRRMRALSKTRSDLGRRYWPDSQILDALMYVTKMPASTLLRPTLCLRRESNATRMSWMSTRSVTRLENEAYCLLGLFGVNMPLLYGEGSGAFERLQLELLRTSNDESIFAWQDSVWHKRSSDAPLLAPSSACFDYLAELRESDGLSRMVTRWKASPYSPLLQRSPYQITNTGLRFEVVDEEHFVDKQMGSKLLNVPLRCKLRHGSYTSRCSMLLSRLHCGHYVRTHLAAGTDDSASVSRVPATERPSRETSTVKEVYIHFGAGNHNACEVGVAFVSKEGRRYRTTCPELLDKHQFFPLAGHGTIAGYEISQA